MSECHDIYEAVEHRPQPNDDQAVAQCHDLYPLAGAAPSAGARPLHECRLVNVQHGAVRVIQVSGSLDWATEREFGDLMRNHCTDRSVVVDLSAAHEDAAGTGALLTATARARKQGQQVVFVVPDGVERGVLLSAGLSEVVPVVRSEREALGWFDAHGVPTADPVRAESVGVFPVDGSVTVAEDDQSTSVPGAEPRVMRVAVISEFGAPLVLEERPVPTPGRGEVVVRVEACGLCHTDIHAAHGDWPVKPSLPLIPGHGAVGKVSAVGSGVAEIRFGDRVAVPWLGWACGRCEYCLSGEETLCRLRRNTGYDQDGAFAEYVKASADFVVKVPATVEPEDAACLSCAGVSAYRAALTSGARPGDLTAVFGVGGLGHLVLQYANIMGASVVAVDTVDEKLTMASDLGAAHIINASKVDPVEVIQTMGGARQAIVAAASRQAAEQALASLRPGGTLVLLAIPADNTLCLPVSETVHNGITVRGSIGGSRVDLARTFALQAAGRTRVVHQARSLSRVNEAIAEIEADEVPARLVFEFR
jgi:propanol-preferring alcohol dehydrogenase